MNTVLVYNKKSGGAFSYDELKKLFKKHDIAIIKAVAMDDSLEHHLKPFIAKGENIAVVGGDGTISAVANLVAGTKAVMAPLPGGTLNHFTKDLGIPQDIDKAIRNLAHSRVKQVDVATVNGRVFINNSSIGLYPSSLQERSRAEKFLGKWLAALVSSLRVLVRFKTYHVQVKNKTYETPFVFVGNNRYEVDSPGVSERSTLDEGVLSVFIAHTASRVALLKIALLTLVGKAHLLDEFDILSVSEVTIRARRSRLHVSRDGEVARLQLPLRYKSLPKSLNVRL
jgi:diacylglycerol kinase family enzyme